MLNLVIFCYGNPSRGDDALAPQLCTLLRERYHHHKHITLVEDFQLQIEHALDLEQQDLVLFIDASVDCEQAFCFSQLHAGQDDSYTTHALHPKAVLQVYQHIKQHSPPPAFLLTLRGYRFELGEALSAAAQQHLYMAFDFLKPLCDKPSIKLWHQALLIGK
jgi:hydrogenase maturation protease